MAVEQTGFSSRYLLEIRPGTFQQKQLRTLSRLHSLREKTQEPEANIRPTGRNEND